MTIFKCRMYMRLLAILTLALFAFNLAAKSVISGHIVDEDNVPVDAATTKLINEDGKILSFQITDKNGFFEYTVEEDCMNATLTVECMGYESYRYALNDFNNSINLMIMLRTASTILKEVIVKAPSVTLRGDTISYRLAAFTGKGDIVLKDAMRNLPGIDISETGKIKYLGKEISNFYIEGMDLLGGKYNVATDNLPVSSVSNVEILNNHQSVKMDKEIFSDNVAINIKLSSKAKFRPVGSYEAKGGYCDNWLYQISGAGMMFNNKFQTILTAKYGNITEFAENANTDHYEVGDDIYSVSQLMGDLGLSLPPLERDRFINPNDAIISLNTLNKISEEATFRTNASYSYSEASYSYLSLKDYYRDNGVVQFKQVQSSESRTHRPNLSLEYKFNSGNKYLTNNLTGHATIKDHFVPSFLDGLSYNQQEALKGFVLRNDFATIWRTNNLRWNFTSQTEYDSTPKGYIEVSGDNSDSFIQSVKSRSFLTKESFSTAYENRYFRIWFPLTLQYSNNTIKTDLNLPGAYNNAVCNNVQVWLAPQYEYTHPMRKYVVRASANVKWEYSHVVNRGTEPLKKAIGQISCSPSGYFNWAISSASTLRTQISYLHQYGDIGDFLTAPIRTDNLFISYKTGILSHRKSFNAVLHYDFKLPLEMWYINADVAYDNTRLNLITNTIVTDSSLEASSFLYPNNSEYLTEMLNFTKIISSINTKISLGGAYTLGRNVVSQDNIIRQQTGQSYSVLAKIITSPWSFMEFDYTGNFTAIYNKFSDMGYNLLSHSHKFKFSVFPIKGLQIKIGADILWKELSENVSKSVGLLDFGVEYKFNYFRLGINLNNALNTRHYSYTIFSGINQFSYDYSLRGRQILLSFSFTR